MPALKRTIEAHTEGFYKGTTTVEFSPDGRILASAGHDCAVRFWDPDTGEQILHLPGHKDAVTALAFFPDGKTLASGDHGSIWVWDVQSGELKWKALAHYGWVHSVAVSPDSTRVLSVCENLRVWDAATGDEVFATTDEKKLHTAVTVAPDGSRAAFNTGSMIRIFDLENCDEVEVLGRHRQEVKSLHFSPDGALLASAGKEGAVKIWNVETGEETAVMKVGSLAGWCVRFSPTSSIVASDGYQKPADGLLRLWDANTGKELANCVAQPDVDIEMQGSHLAIYTLAFSPDGKTLASGAGDGTVKLWDVDAILAGEQR